MSSAKPPTPTRKSRRPSAIVRVFSTPEINDEDEADAAARLEHKAVALRLTQAMLSSSASSGRSLSLVGEVDGFSSHLQLYVMDPKVEPKPQAEAPGELICERHFTNSKFNSFADMLHAFLRVSGAEFPKKWPVLAVFAVSDPQDLNSVKASPISSNKVTFTLPSASAEWVIDGKVLQRECRIHRVRLINHLGAAGYGMLTLGQSEFTTLQQGPPPQVHPARPPPMAMMGADSRLGECYMTGRPDGKYDVWPTEGGHTEFTPRTPLEVEFLEYMKAELGSSRRISVWRVVSWWGLYNVYAFLRTKFPDRVNPDVDRSIESSGELKGEVVARFAVASDSSSSTGGGGAGGGGGGEGAAAAGRPPSSSSSSSLLSPKTLTGTTTGENTQEKYESLAGHVTDSLCQQAMEVVVSTFGAEAGAVALKYNPVGGVFIAGGLVTQHLDFFMDTSRHWGFLQCFHDKGRMKPMLEKLTVKAVIAENLAQRGVKLLAFRQLQKAVFKYSDLVMSGDVGGTNCRLQVHAVADVATIQSGQQPPGDVIFEKEYSNEKFANFEEIVTLFLREAGCKRKVKWPVAACIACAGPVENTPSGERVRFTNRSEAWVIDSAGLSRSQGIPEIKLVNDFAANGYGLLTLDDTNPQEVCILQEGNTAEVKRKHDRPPPMACIGAGTGLGECYLTGRPDGKYDVWPTEGGHTDFAPRTPLQVKLLAFLKKLHNQPNRVSVERVVSGRGLYDVYRFLREEFPQDKDDAVNDEIEATSEDLRGGMVAKHAPFKTEGDKLCSMALNIVISTYGAEAGSAALKYNPRGGLYIAGGLAPKNLEHIQDEEREDGFMKSFLDKGVMSDTLKQIPVKVVMAQDIGKRGAKLLAVRMLMKQRGAVPSLATTSPKSGLSSLDTTSALLLGVALGASCMLIGMRYLKVQASTS